jgi:hypothetical protein
VLPTLWFRNSWSWGCTHEGCEIKPFMQQAGPSSVTMSHATLGQFRFELERPADNAPLKLLFTENETNTKRLFNAEMGPALRRMPFTIT